MIQKQLVLACLLSILMGSIAATENKNRCVCSEENIVITQECSYEPPKNRAVLHRSVPSGPSKDLVSQWTVSMTNTCNCPATDIMLNCKSFAPTGRRPPFDSLHRTSANGLCIVLNGGPIPPHSRIKFGYGNDNELPLNCVYASFS